MSGQYGVLVVEDSPAVADAISMKMEGSQFEPYAIASSCVEAIQQVRKRNPDVILMDINLRGRVDGVETAYIIQEFTNAPVIYLSGMMDADCIQRAKKTNFFSFLEKPITTHELLVNLEMAVARKKVDTTFGKILRESQLDKDDDRGCAFKKIGLLIKQSRKARSITQQDAAKFLGINYRHYQDIEAGKINLKLDTIIKLINFYNLAI